MRNKKIIFITCSVTCAIALVVGSAFALFSARTDSDFSAIAGTVRIDVDDLDLTNPDNINPGDNDPDNPEDATGGTEHVFSYTVTNNGNKSVRTRHTIIITCNNSEDPEELYDARVYEMLEDGVELTEKTYVLENGTVKKQVGEDDFVKAVKYVFYGDIMDGKGDAVEDGGDAEKESGISGLVKEGLNGEVSKTYEYMLAMRREAVNHYQGADVNIEVIIEAMQYRHTDNDDWSLAGIVEKTYTTADVNVDVVPSYDEDRYGNYLPDAD